MKNPTENQLGDAASSTLRPDTIYRNGPYEFNLTASPINTTVMIEAATMTPTYSVSTTSVIYPPADQSLDLAI